MMHIALHVSGLQFPPDELLLDELLEDALLLDELLEDALLLDEPLPDDMPLDELLEDADEDPLKPDDDDPDAAAPLDVDLPPPPPALVSNESVPTAQLHRKTLGRTNTAITAPS